MGSSIVFKEDNMLTMSRYPDKYFDLAPVDIQYGIGVGKMAYLHETGTRVKQKNGNRLNAHRKNDTYALKEWDEKPPEQAYFDELRRVSKHQIIFGIDYVNWTGVGTGRIKWDKGVAEGMSFKRYETAYCSLIDTEVILPLLWSGMQQAKSISEPMTVQGNKKLNEKRIHPCHKPIFLYQRLFLDYGFEGMKVIDTHLGGGSSRIVADMMNCEFVGSEIDTEYYDKQELRYKQYKSQLRIF